MRRPLAAALVAGLAAPVLLAGPALAAIEWALCPHGVIQQVGPYRQVASPAVSTGPLMDGDVMVSDHLHRYQRQVWVPLAGWENVGTRTTKKRCGSHGA